MNTETIPTESADLLIWAEANGKHGMFRFGALPTARDYYGRLVSRNHRDGGYEEGVSVYDGWMVGDVLVLDLREVDAASAMFILDVTDTYRVTGSYYADERGSDGEPLMYDDGDKTLAATKMQVSTIKAVLV